MTVRGYPPIINTLVGPGGPIEDGPVEDTGARLGLSLAMIFCVSGITFWPFYFCSQPSFNN